jgi:CheY-like chemotaxis protein
MRKAEGSKISALPVILLTASSEQATIARCETLGALYVPKGEQTWEYLEPLIYRIFRERAVSREAEPVKAGRAPRVLIVDDDPIALKTIASGFQKYQVETIVASNGMQGFWLALKEEPDVIFTDYHMSGGDGHYLLSRIKSTPSTRSIPVVVFSARTLTDGERFAMQRDLRGRGQAAAFLTKPISTGALVAELRRHVQLPSG